VIASEFRGAHVFWTKKEGTRPTITAPVTPDFGEDVFHSFPVSQLIKHEDLVVPELIAIIVVCNSRFSFLD